MIEVLKQALEALYPISHNSTDDYRGQADKAITSLRQAIAELESQEPVSHQKWCASLTQLLLSMPPQPAPCNCHPPQRTWVGLTDEEVKHEWEVWRANIPRYAGFAKGIEAKLKERNI